MQYDYFVILKGTNKDLATFEFEDLFRVYFDEKIKLERISNVYYSFKSNVKLCGNEEFFTRLTFTKHVSLINFVGSFDDFKKNIKSFNINQFEGLSFAVEASRLKKDFELPIPLAKLAAPIFDEFENPKVNLKNYGVRFCFFYSSETEFYFTTKIYHNEMDYLGRMPKFRPVVMPYTLKSDMARNAINFLGIKEGVVLDPFCGIGGILLEAYDMGFKVIGNDISWNDLKYFKENFDHYFPKANYVRTLADSSNQFLKPNTIDGIVSDIPYGKSCRRLGTNLYEDFLKSARVYLKDGARIVLIYANFLEFKSLALKYFNEVTEVNHYINKSMTRHILVLENTKK